MNDFPKIRFAAVIFLIAVFAIWTMFVLVAVSSEVQASAQVRAFATQPVQLTEVARVDLRIVQEGTTRKDGQILKATFLTCLKQQTDADQEVLFYFCTILGDTAFTDGQRCVIYQEQNGQDWIVLESEYDANNLVNAKSIAVRLSVTPFVGSVE